jgi:hypothetical protein
MVGAENVKRKEFTNRKQKTKIINTYFVVHIVTWGEAGEELCG